MFVEQHHRVGRLQLLQQQFALLGLLLLFRKVFGVSELGNHFDLERHVMAYALCVIVDAGNEMLVLGLSHQ